MGVKQTKPHEKADDIKSDKLRLSSLLQVSRDEHADTQANLEAFKDMLSEAKSAKSKLDMVSDILGDLKNADKRTIE